MSDPTSAPDGAPAERTASTGGSSADSDTTDSRIAELEADNEQLRERMAALERAIGDDVDAERPDHSDTGTPTTTTQGEADAGPQPSDGDSGGLSVSRRGALGALASLGLLGVASQPASAAGQTLNFGETVAGSPSSGVGLNLIETSGSGGSIGARGISDSSSGRGLAGIARATDGNTIGVVGNSKSPSGRGIVGKATASSGNNVGLLGFTNSVSGTGLQGTARATSGNTVGLRGRTLSPDSTAVLGNADNGSGATKGVRGVTKSSNDSAAGVQGEAQGSNTFGSGVRGTTAGEGDFGRLFPFPTEGVLGEATASSGIVYNAGVRGTNSASNGQAYGVIGSTFSETPDAAGVLGKSGGTLLDQPAPAVRAEGYVDSQEGYRGPVGSSAYLSSNFDVKGQSQKIPFDSLVADQRDEFDTGNHWFECRYDGTYFVEFGLESSSTTTGNVGVFFVINQGNANSNPASGQGITWDIEPPDNGSMARTITKTIYGLKTGNQISVSISDTTSELTLTGGLEETHLSVRQVGGGGAFTSSPMATSSSSSSDSNDSSDPDGS
jgi:hypothetical protein